MKQTHQTLGHMVTDTANARPPRRNGTVRRASGLSPEVELILCCARTQHTAETRARIEELVRGPLDWKEVGGLAYRHRVVPLLHHSLQAVPGEGVPAYVRRELKNFFVLNGFRNGLRTQELQRILDLLAEHDVPAIPFKGPLLAELVYGSVSMRQFGDLDILIQMQHLEKAEQLLLTLDYTKTEEQDLDGWQEQAYMQLTHQRTYRRMDGHTEHLAMCIMVELQWTFASRYFSSPLLPEQFWKRQQRVLLRGKPVRAFAQEDLLLFLCLHGARHLWSCLQWVCDVAELIRTYPNLDWQQLLQRAQQLGLERILLLGLYLAHDLLQAPVASVAWARIKADPAIRSLADIVCEQLFGERTGEEDQAAYLIRVRRFHVLVRERVLDKARYLLRGLTPTQKDWTFLSLPRGAGFLYYVLRPIRIVRDLLTPH